MSSFKRGTFSWPECGPNYGIEKALDQVIIYSLARSPTGFSSIIVSCACEDIVSLEHEQDCGFRHGIPYGLKDIISVPHYKTTWGSTTFKDQVLDIEAWVYKRLRSARAVLIVKLVTGSLAYDDIWFGGRTPNQWNFDELCTSSSTGPAATTSADLAAFAIGSETAGSMTYPAGRCGVTSLRPTFGTAGRSGVMSISESLDNKLGPFCRNVMDCAVVLDAVRGRDPDDLSSREILIEDPFSIDIRKLTVGYLEDADMEVVSTLYLLLLH